MSIQQTRVCDAPSCAEAGQHFTMGCDDGRRWEIDVCAGHFDLLLTLPWNQTRPSPASERAKAVARRRSIEIYNRSFRPGPSADGGVGAGGIDRGSAGGELYSASNTTAP